MSEGLLVLGIGGTGLISVWLLSREVTTEEGGGGLLSDLLAFRFGGTAGCAAFNSWPLSPVVGISTGYWLCI